MATKILGREVDRSSLCGGDLFDLKKKSLEQLVWDDHSLWIYLIRELKQNDNARPEG